MRKASVWVLNRRSHSCLTEKTVPLDAQQRPLHLHYPADSAQRVLLAGLVDKGEVVMALLRQRSNFITGEVQETLEPIVFPSTTLYQRVLIAPDHHYMFALRSSGHLDVMIQGICTILSWRRP